MPAINLQKYLLYSVFVHALVVFLLHFWGRQNPSRTISRQAISIEIFEPEALKPKTDETKAEKKQIVEQEKINNEIDPLANYLSSHNQKVLKETVAKNHGDFQNRKFQAAPSQGANQEAVQQRKATLLPKDLFGSYKDSLAKSFDQQRREKGRAGSKGAETSQTRDYLPDKEAGMETLLSTREFVYFTYYNRIRNQLTQYWEPKIKQKILALFKKGRRIASNGDRITKVQIVLDAGGSLMKVQVLGASGVQDLDEAAVEAFKAAAPFPNPPKGIVDSDGTVKIEWEFVVEA